MFPLPRIHSSSTPPNSQLMYPLLRNYISENQSQFLGHFLNSIPIRGGLAGVNFPQWRIYGGPKCQVIKTIPPSSYKLKNGWPNIVTTATHRSAILWTKIFNPLQFEKWLSEYIVTYHLPRKFRNRRLKSQSHSQTPTILWTKMVTEKSQHTTPLDPPPPPFEKWQTEYSCSKKNNLKNGRPKIHSQVPAPPPTPPPP